MLHLGDITAIDGSIPPPVDVIIGGSPCQDLSVAGKRQGLSGERSSLFLEQVRIVREMRNATRDTKEGERPRYLVWENVPGAFSTNGGEDFRTVLEEVCKIKDERANIPRPPQGKWQTNGCIVGEGYSVAWRVLDAKFWGVPQRRRRIALVADFGGKSAPEILFVRRNLQGDSTASIKSAHSNGSSVGGSIVKAIGFDSYNQSSTGETSRTLIARHTDADGIPLVFDFSKCYGVPLGTYPENMRPQIEEGATLYSGTSPGQHNGVITYGKLRKLTPLECERLQGYPDGWTDIGDYINSEGKLRHTSDSSRYKALGNSIAIPPWKWVIKRLCACYERDATMGSLFDGIGGFPYIWEQLNGKGSCLWASEIEEFPIAVTKARFA